MVSRNTHQWRKNRIDSKEILSSLNVGIFYEFSRNKQFKNLGSTLIEKNEIDKEIAPRILSWKKKCFYGLTKIQESCLREIKKH